MTIERNLRRVALVLGSGLLVACASVLGFPDRALDDTADADTTEASTPDSGGDQPDTSFDAGPPTAALDKTSLDFGAVGCGTTPADQVVTIQNTGGPLTFTATLADTTGFSINGSATGTIPTGGKGTVAISSIAIPASTTAGTVVTTTLTITTNDPQKPSTDIPVKLTAAGGVLTLTPSAVSFGEAYFNATTDAGVAATPVPVDLKNTGNAPVTVTFTQPTDPQFQVRWGSYPTGATLQPGDSMTGLQGKFTPTSNGDFTTVAPIVVTGALCGTNPSALSLSGAGSTSPATVAPGTLDFGLVDCGTTGAAQTITITNNSATTDFTINGATLGAGAGSPFTTNFASNIVVGHTVGTNTATITVTPKAIPSTSAITALTDTLTITTTAAADSPHVVNLKITPHGAILSPSLTSINFGSVRVTTQGTAPFTMTNSGNAPAAVTYTPSDAAFGATPNGQAIAAGTSLQENATFSPSQQAAYSGTLAVSVPQGTPLCAALPSPIAVSGSGAVSVQFTPSSLDFGLVNCNTQATAKTLKITNTGASAFSWTATSKNGFYTLTPASSGTGKLAVGASANITVTPIKVPQYPVFNGAPQQDFYADTITFTTNPALESPYLVNVTMTPAGAVLSYQAATNPLDFGTVKVTGQSSTKQYSVVNAGNKGATVTLTESGGATSMYTETPASNFSVGAGTSATINATFDPSATGTQTTSVVMTTTGTVLCAPLPANLGYTGVGK